MIRSKKVFTLIELLVVISIISLLIAILLPALGRTRDAAVSAKCASHLHQIGMGFQAYAADSRMTFPPLNNATASYGEDYLWYTNLLSRYVAVPQWKKQSTGNISSNGGAWGCPAVKPDRFIWGGGLSVCSGIVRYSLDGGTPRLDEIRHPSRLFLIGDAWKPNLASKNFATWIDFKAPAGAGIGGSSDWYPDTNTGPEQVAGRHHSDAANASFFDGHVSSFAYEQAFNNVNNMFNWK